MAKIPAAKKRFILDKLIPFILRAEGRGFGMSCWWPKAPEGTTLSIDGIKRKVPSCGTVACIGGSLEAMGVCKDADRDGHEVLGLSYEQAIGLFYRWGIGDAMGNPGKPCWPLSFMKLFASRKTPLGKAKVAAELLREIVKTDGECLNRE